MIFFTHHRITFPLPAGHKFPLGKYALLAERIAASGLGRVLDSPDADWAAIERVHDPEYVARVRRGELSLREQRVLGLPWSAALVERGRRSVGGTLASVEHALRHGIGMNLGGGTHHAGVASGRGYCLFNDVAVAIADMRSRGVVEAGRVLVVDCDVHQGDGTAEIFADDPTVFTLSLHGARNYPFTRIPSDLDVDLPTGTTDGPYLDALRSALDDAFAAMPSPGFVFYLAGADPWEGDRLGRLSLSKDGLRARDELVVDTVTATGAPVCVVLAGGYAPDIADTVDINAATAAVVAGRLRVRT